MKNILTILLIILSFTVFSQKTDSTVISMPYQVGQQILLDLNECDETKKLYEISLKEVKLLNKKIVEKDSIISDLKDDVNLCDTIVKKNNEKFVIVDEENKKLRDDITNLKLKNTIFNIVGGAIIGGLTYIILFK